MPNYVKNNIEFFGSQLAIDSLKRCVRSPNEINLFDFNKIIPRPACLNVPSGYDETVAAECLHAAKCGLDTCKEYRDTISNKSFSDYVNLGLIYEQNKVKYGHPTWFDWSVEHWGTKWNSCDASWDGNTCTFLTAWSAPIPIFRKLAEMFPDIAFDVEYADEDYGNNCGTVNFHDGIFSTSFENSEDFARNVWEDNE